VTPVAPDEGVWRAILARTAGAEIAAAPIAAAAPPAPRRRRRWPALALAASIAVVAVAGWLAMQGLPGNTLWQSAAELRPEAGAPIAWRIEFDAAKRELRSAAQRPLPSPASGAHELWALRAGNAPPVSLGVLPTAGVHTQALSPVQLAALAAATRLAVSEEPAGGSPTGLPTGRVVLVAPLAPLRFSS
jgi:anti-sigma-K factor RskA